MKQYKTQAQTKMTNQALNAFGAHSTSRLQHNLNQQAKRASKSDAEVDKPKQLRQHTNRLAVGANPIKGCYDQNSSCFEPKYTECCANHHNLEANKACWPQLDLNTHNRHNPSALKLKAYVQNTWTEVELAASGCPKRAIETPHVKL
ncbi:hypothetical protein AAHH84_00155 [Candidatus Hodgkinia cicadicola]